MQIALFAAITVLFTGGCSSYKLVPITAAQARSDFSAGETYKIAPRGAFLKRSSSTGAIGLGQPKLELTPFNFKEFPAVHDVPAGTRVRIDRFVRFDQSGFYDCGFDGWKFAIGRVLDGDLRGTSFLIRQVGLQQGEGSCVLRPD